MLDGWHLDLLVVDLAENGAVGAVVKCGAVTVICCSVFCGGRHVSKCMWNTAWRSSGWWILNNCHTAASNHAHLQASVPRMSAVRAAHQKRVLSHSMTVAAHSLSCITQDSPQLKLHHSGQLLKKQMFYLINHNPSQQINAIYLGLKDDGC